MDIPTCRFKITGNWAFHRYPIVCSTVAYSAIFAYLTVQFRSRRALALVVFVTIIHCTLTYFSHNPILVNIDTRITQYTTKSTAPSYKFLFSFSCKKKIDDMLSFVSLVQLLNLLHTCIEGAFEIHTYILIFITFHRFPIVFIITASSITISHETTYLAFQSRT